MAFGKAKMPAADGEESDEDASDLEQPRKSANKRSMSLLKPREPKRVASRSMSLLKQREPKRVVSRSMSYGGKGVTLATVWM